MQKGLQIFRGLMVAILLGVGGLRAELDPMGVVSIPILGSSDNHVAIPFFRSVAFNGQVESIAGNVITVSGEPAWASGRFVFGAANNPDANITYFVLLSSGDKAGLKGTVLDNGSNDLTLDLDSEALNGVSSDAVDGVGFGDYLQIIAYWTPASLFEASTIPDQLKINRFDNEAYGYNKAPSIFTYFEGFGWYDGSFRVADHIPMDTLDGFVIRTPEGSDDFICYITGTVPMTRARGVFKTSNQNVPNDYRVGIQSPIETALGDSGLGLTDQIKVSVYDNSERGYNKSPIIYTYFEGFGWYDGTFNQVDNLTLEVWESFIVRKPATNLEDSVIWSFLPPYLE